MMDEDEEFTEAPGLRRYWRDFHARCDRLKVQIAIGERPKLARAKRAGDDAIGSQMVILLAKKVRYNERHPDGCQRKRDVECNRRSQPRGS